MLFKKIRRKSGLSVYLFAFEYHELAVDVAVHGFQISRIVDFDEFIQFFEQSIVTRMHGRHNKRSVFEYHHKAHGVVNESQIRHLHDEFKQFFRVVDAV